MTAFTRPHISQKSQEAIAQSYCDEALTLASECTSRAWLTTMQWFIKHLFVSASMKQNIFV